MPDSLLRATVSEFNTVAAIRVYKVYRVIYIDGHKVHIILCHGEGWIQTIKYLLDFKNILQNCKLSSVKQSLVYGTAFNFLTF